MTIELPEHLRTGPLAEAAARALQDANSMASASNSVPRISLLGREFKTIESGEATAKFRDYLDVIILGVEPEAGRMIKTFYAKGYTSGAKEPPTCSSDDGIAPSPWVTEKQSQQCSNCPKNVFGSATSPSGKQTKACRDSKRIWVKLANGNMVSPGPGLPPVECEESKKPLADRTMYGMNVTVASLKSFSEHGRVLTSLGQGPAVCVTRLIMVEKEYPELEFKLVSWLSAADTPISLEMAEKRPWKVFKGAAALALAGGGEGGSARAGLPTSLPGIPDHLRQAAQTSQAAVQTGKTDPPWDANVVENTAVQKAADLPPTEKVVVSNAQIDKQIQHW